jgi:serine/threonine-protein kinase
VQRLLDAEPASTQQIDAPVFSMLAELAGAETLEPGARLGAWTLIRKIGQGGMSSVYLAQRSDGHFEQTAAVKLLRGLPSPAALQYLARERQILASLAHPNISRLLDGGARPLGQPYLVMEYLEGGLPIDQYLVRCQLPLEAVVQMLITVCAAVSFAHSRLVVHCDLKPANVLVDAQGRPLLLDFGIARMLGGETVEGPASVAAQVSAFTPGYASPEQVRGDPLSTQADVYSLGYLLRALVRTYAPPSELLAIAALATQAEPTARYSSVAAFARDLDRFIAGEPVQAMPARWRYQAVKLLQRQWPAMVVVLAFLLTVLGFTLQLVTDRDRALAAEQHAINERDRATQAELSSRQISQLLGNILSSVDPDNARSMDRTLMRSLLDSAAEKARVELHSNPLVLRQVETVVADSYRACFGCRPFAQHFHAVQSRHRFAPRRRTGGQCALLPAGPRAGAAALWRGQPVDTGPGQQSDVA